MCSLEHLLALLCHSSAFAQKSNIVFPTGMKWKEAVVEPGQPLDPALTVEYEIGNDVVIRGVAYKEIYKNGMRENYWIREADGLVWLLTEEYDNEIKLYDFNWHSGTAVRVEFLREGDGRLSLETEEFTPNKSCMTTIGDYAYPYYHQLTFSIIYGIGRVADIHRNSCLLGYMKRQVPIPGIIYHKVLWISVNGKNVFSSDSVEEWTLEIPNFIANHAEAVPKNISKNCCFNLQGRRLTTQPRRGLYIKDGRKMVVK